jgi:hypothetical protein
MLGIINLKNGAKKQLPGKILPLYRFSWLMEEYFVLSNFIFPKA